MAATANLKTWVEIDSDAVKHNIRIFKKIFTDQKLLAVIKCNAYGHGLTEMARLCVTAGVDWLGVATVEEAGQLRRSGVRKPILVISYTPRSQLNSVLKFNLSQVIYDFTTLDHMAALAQRRNRKFKVHLKIDSGMSRQGILPGQVEAYAEKLNNLNRWVDMEGIMTHLGLADDFKESSYTKKQLSLFKQSVKTVLDYGLKPRWIHVFNTAASLSFKRGGIPLNLNRVGIGIYGLAPSPGFRRRFSRLGLRPALSWKAKIVQIKKIPKGYRIGYGGTETAKRDTLLAVLPVGHYHGLPRLYSSVGYVLISGRRCRLMGVISMNLTVADITDLKLPPKLWDEAVLIGRQGGEEITADEFAAKVGTINYEIVTRINPLIPRIYL